MVKQRGLEVEGVMVVGICRVLMTLPRLVDDEDLGLLWVVLIDSLDMYLSQPFPFFDDSPTQNAMDDECCEDKSNVKSYAPSSSICKEVRTSACVCY